MASDDPLSMSLDDIIKKKRFGRGGGRNQRGRGRGRGSNVDNTDQYANYNSGGGQQRNFQRERQGQNNLRGRQGRGSTRGLVTKGRGKIMRLTTTRTGVKGNIRGRNISSSLGSRLGGKVRKSSINNDTAREMILKRIQNRAQALNELQSRDAASSSGYQQPKGRLQDMQRALQVNRNRQRKEIINQRRGIDNSVGMKTSGNLGAPLRVRVGSGTIVRGLRSDQLLLQKIKQAKAKKVRTRERLEDFEEEEEEDMWERKERSRSARDASLDSSSIVSLSSHRGLTVSIKNNIRNSLENGTSSKNRKRISRRKKKMLQEEDMLTPATFTIVNDHYDSEYDELPESPRRLAKHKVITKDQRSRNKSTLTIGSDNVRSLPEPHRQILDQKIQKEIAMLQGKEEVTLNSGPGPGVKGFRHVPNQTKRSLNERFTNERTVTL